MYETLLSLTMLLGNAWDAGPCLTGSAGLVSPDADGDYQWEWRRSDPGRYYLFQGGVQIGGYDIWFDYYRPYDATRDRWGEKCDPPILPPNKHKPPAAAARIVENYGVDYSEFPAGEACSVNGTRCAKERAKRAIEGKGDNLQDDSQKPRLTIFGSETERGQVLAALASALKDKLDIQAYAPDHWIVAQRGFQVGRLPTIYLQRPDGTVLHRQEGWDGAESLAKAIERADPNYDPAKDPDLRKPKPQPEPAPNVAPTEPPCSAGCPNWALHVLNSVLTTVTLVTLYLLTHRSPPWTPPPSSRS
jgi:hypothetical protein